MKECAQCSCFCMTEPLRTLDTKDPSFCKRQNKNNARICCAYYFFFCKYQKRQVCAIESK